MAEGAIKRGWHLVKEHWGVFLVVGSVLVVAALWYDHKNSGSLTQRVASLPIVGKIFAA